MDIVKCCHCNELILRNQVACMHYDKELKTLRAYHSTCWAELKVKERQKAEHEYYGDTFP